MRTGFWPTGTRASAAYGSSELTELELLQRATKAAMQLTHWSEFNTLRRCHQQAWGAHLPTGLTSRINIFKARFDIAVRMEKIMFEPQFDDNTMQAYLSGTRLLMAYSAGEAYMRAEGLFRDRKDSRITTWSISRVALAKRMLPLARLLLEKADSHGALGTTTKKYLTDFVAGEKADVRPIASALRHVHAHGGLTARSITGDGESQDFDFVECINELAMALLERCDEKFSQLFKEIASILNVNV